MAAPMIPPDHAPAFLAAHGWGDARILPLAGDASFRRYFRVVGERRQAVLMDAPPPHEDPRPFIAVAEWLCEQGMSAPAILARDLAQGLLLIEDLGHEGVVDGKARWVTQGYLQEEKPETGPAAASANASCTNGTSVPAGVSPNIAAVHRAVCAQFPSITSYGTFRSGGGDHGRGLAVDIMVSGELGWQVAEFVRANAGQLGVSYAIYSQRIWSVERGGEGWRPMSDRGSATANHYDHVHVSTF